MPQILIADDHDLFRRGLRYALADGIHDAQVLEAGSVMQATALIEHHQELALASFDLRMPGMQMGEGLLPIRRLRPRLPIVVLSGFEDRQHVLSAIQMGASGFIPKSLPAEQIVLALIEVMQGRIYIPPSITEVDALPADPLTPGVQREEALPAAPKAVQLTPRQREVLERLMAGRSTKEIGRDLDLAEGTVKIHLAALFRVLGARNRVEAVRRAISLGLPLPSDSR